MCVLKIYGLPSMHHHHLILTGVIMEMIDRCGVVQEYR